MIETGGSLDVSPFLGVPNVILSVDVKCPSSKMQDHNRWANLPLLREHETSSSSSSATAGTTSTRSGVLRRYTGKSTVVFQPVWGTDAGRLADWVLHDRLDVRVMLQEHKVLWGDVPGR